MTAAERVKFVTKFFFIFRHSRQILQVSVHICPSCDVLKT